MVTRFELEPADGVKVSKISSLVKDLARSLAVVSVRIVEVIPGKSVVGIEIPNERREVVRLKQILNSNDYRETASPLTLALGKDIAGAPVMVDVGKMPHLLVAGTTGSGKSVGINAMLLSMLYKATPDQLRLILVDPKMLELAVYEGIPHLLTPVVTDMRDAAQALNWCVAEMERRYQLMAALGVRNIAGYNRRIEEGQSIGQPVLDPLWEDSLDGGTEAEPPALEPLPFIVVVIDEFADMMMIVGKKGGAVDRPDRTEGEGGRYPLDPRDPASLGGRHYRPYQGEHSRADFLPGFKQGRLPHDPGPGRRGAASWTWGHARPAARHRRA